MMYLVMDMKKLLLVMLTGIDTRAGTWVRGSRRWGQVTKFSPVMIPYLFGQVMGL